MDDQNKKPVLDTKEDPKSPPLDDDQKPAEGPEEAPAEPVAKEPEAQEPSPVILGSETTPESEVADSGQARMTKKEIASSQAPRNDNESDKTDQASETPAEENQPTAEETMPAPTPVTYKEVRGARWYVVHTYSGHEAKVAATLKQRVESQKLQEKVLDILIPTQEKIEIKEGKKAKVKEKIFPGYLLIRMVLDDNTWLVVRTTPGITSFVGMGNRPTPLPDEEVKTIQRFMSMEAPKFKTTFSAGEAVKIVDGPFSEFLGSISEIDDEKGKLKVLVSIFGRETPVELDFLQVAKL